MTLQFLRDPLVFLSEKQKRHEDGVVRITLAGKPVLLVWDRHAARAVFEGDDAFQKVHRLAACIVAGSLQLRRLAFLPCCFGCRMGRHSCQTARWRAMVSSSAMERCVVS